MVKTSDFKPVLPRDVIMQTLRNQIKAVVCTLCTCLTLSQLSAAIFPPDYSIQMDSQGNMVALWQEVTDGSNSAIFSSNSTFGGSWSAPQQLSVGMYSEAPTLVVAPSGNAVAVWRTRATLAPYTLYASTIDLQSSATWTAPRAVSSSGDNVSNDFEVVVNSNNQAVISWELLPMDGIIYASTSTLSEGTNSWSTPVALNSPSVARMAPLELAEPSLIQKMHNKLCDTICPSN